MDDLRSSLRLGAPFLALLLGLLVAMELFLPSSAALGRTGADVVTFTSAPRLSLGEAGSGL